MSVQLPEQLWLLLLLLILILILVGLPPHKRRHFKQLFIIVAGRLFILSVCVSLIYWHYYQLQYKTWCGSWPNEGRKEGKWRVWGWGLGLGLPVGETASALGVLLEIKFVKMAMANSIFINCKSRRVQLPHMEGNPTPAAAAAAPRHAPATLVPPVNCSSCLASFARLSRVWRIMLIVCTSLGTNSRRQSSHFSTAGVRRL